MYLRRCYRRKDGKRHAYWALVESYRTARGPWQRVVAYLGEMDAAGRLGLQACAEGRPEARQSGLFETPEAEWIEVDWKRGGGAEPPVRRRLAGPGGGSAHDNECGPGRHALAADGARAGAGAAA